MLTIWCVLVLIVLAVLGPGVSPAPWEWLLAVGSVVCLLAELERRLYTE